MVGVSVLAGAKRNGGSFGNDTEGNEGNNSRFKNQRKIKSWSHQGLCLKKNGLTPLRDDAGSGTERDPDAW